jgi:hypothetical protein
LPGYGDPRVLIGRTITVPQKYMMKAFFAEKCHHGKVDSVVRRRITDEESGEEAEPYFKIYNHKHHRIASRPNSEGEWHLYCNVTVIG